MTGKGGKGCERGKGRQNEEGDQERNGRNI